MGLWVAEHLSPWHKTRITQQTHPPPAPETVVEIPPTFYNRVSTHPLQETDFQGMNPQ